jgi:hypothetical protein
MEGTAQYVPNRHGIMFAYNKLTNVAANNLSNGQIWARFSEILADGSISFYDAEQIDGGRTVAGNQQMLMMPRLGAADSACPTWEYYDSGDTYEHINWNPFK